jgi:hypothetical protein
MLTLPTQSQPLPEETRAAQRRLAAEVEAIRSGMRRTREGRPIDPE